MGSLWRRTWTFLAVLALGTGTASVASVGATAVGTVPEAEISIVSGHGPLNVAFVAQSTGFPSAVSSYVWTFGDGTTATTSRPLVSHTYPHTGIYHVHVVESDAGGMTARGAGILGVFRCGPHGLCTESTSSGAITQLQVSGPTATAAERSTVDLFGGPFEISHCQSRVVPTGAITDSTFAGNLTVTIKYNSSDVSATPTTCFQSEVPFVDAAGKLVRSGALPTCTMTGSTAPCVESYNVSGTHVTKTLLIPPGDPKVGAP
jgi:PKD repeat protein